MSYLKPCFLVTVHKACNIAKRSSLAASLTLAVTALGFNPIDAAFAQVDADFSRYCRENHPGSMYQRRNQSWGVEHACNRGGVRQGIDLGRACQLTTGNQDHEIMGQRVICSGQPAPQSPDPSKFAGGPDFNAYCREFHPGSAHEKRYEPHGVEFYCRKPGATGGFTLQNIDLSIACKTQFGTNSFQVLGDTVMCMHSDDPVTAGTGNPGAGGGGGGRIPDNDPDTPPRQIKPQDITRIKNQPFPPLDPRDIIDTKGTGNLEETPVKYANLKGCGHGDPSFGLLGVADVMKSNADPGGLDGAGWDQMGIDLPCQGLSGGLVVQFAEYCARGRGDQTVMARPSGRPICWRTGGESSLARQDPSELNGHFGLSGSSLTGVCMQAYADQNDQPAFDHVTMTVILKYQLKSQHVECFYLQRSALLNLWGL